MLRAVLLFMYKGRMMNIHKTNLTQQLLYNKRHIWHFLLFVGLLCALTFTSFGNATTTFADSIPGGNVADPSVRAVDIAKPAVVRIITNVNSHVSVRFPTGTVLFPQNGSEYQLRLSGSGTFITAHGDILTADHVINHPASDPSISQFFADTAAPDVTKYVNQHNTFGSQLTTNQVDQKLRSGEIPSQPVYDTVASEVFLSTDYTGPLTAADF